MTVDERDAEYDGLSADLKALANPKRLRLLRFLAEPRHLEEIASELGVARQTAQEHVQQLVAAGLLQPVRGRGDHGPVTDYLAVPQRVFAVLERLNCVGGVAPDLEEDADFRRVTAPLATDLGAGPADQDLPRLVIVHGMRIGQTILLAGSGPWLVGRDPHAAACLDYDPYASQRHAEVRRAPGGFEVADLYSSNGTSLDWKRLPRGEARRLENGAVVGVGKSLLVFRKP